MVLTPSPNVLSLPTAIGVIRSYRINQPPSPCTKEHRLPAKRDGNISVSGSPKAALAPISPTPIRLLGAARNLFGAIVITSQAMSTVHVRHDTRRLLGRLKREMGLGTYDEVIKRLAKSKSGLPGVPIRCVQGIPPFREGGGAGTCLPALCLSIDTYAWFEYLLGSRAGVKAQRGIRA